MVQNSFLRLLTTLAVGKHRTLANSQAIDVLNALRRDPRIESCFNEPPKLEERWFTLAAADFPAPLQWMDAYLASFAIESGMRFVTFDRGFRKFTAAGLDLVLLS